MMLDNKISTFLAVAECRSFSKAAKQLYLSTVSVMKHIDMLEADFDVKLFDRSPRGVALTPAGRSLYEDSVRLTAEAHDAIDRARSVASSHQETIRIGSSIMRPCRPLMDLWTLIGEKLPYKVEVVPFDDALANPREVNRLLAKTIDCFASPYESNRCNVMMLGSCPCMIATPQTHRLALRKVLTWDDLAGERLMLVRRGAGSTSIDNLRNELREKHPEITIVDVDRFYDISVLNECASEGILAEIPSVWANVHPALKAIPFNWDYHVPYGIVYAKDPSERVAGFIDTLSKQLAEEDIATMLSSYLW